MALALAVQRVLIISLQGVIMMRVYALYRQSPYAAFVLISSFVISQVGSAIATVAAFTDHGGHEGEATAKIEVLSGAALCVWKYSSTSWDSVLFIVSTFCFETTALVLALYRLWTYYRRSNHPLSSFWKSNNLFFLVARENLAYALIIFLWLMVTVPWKTNVEITKDARASHEVTLVLQAFWTSMFGPYLVLNVRKHDDDRLNGRSLAEGDTLSTIAFAAGRYQRRETRL